MTSMTISQALRISLAPIALALLTGTAVSAQNRFDQLAALAREARTPAQHASLAKQYRLHAETFDRRAAELEARAGRLGRTLPGIAHKWPALAPPALNSAKQDALDARESARQSRDLADWHLRLSVEAQAAE